MVEKVEAHLTMLRDLLKEASLLGVDVASFEEKLSKLEKALAESESDRTKLEEVEASIDTLMSEVSKRMEEYERELERMPSPLEADVYEYIMKHGGMSISGFSKQRGVSEGDVRGAVKRLVELDMIEVGGVKGGEGSS